MLRTLRDPSMNAWQESRRLAPPLQRLSSHLFAGETQAEAGARVGADVDLVLLVELLDEVVEEDLVEVAAAQVPVPRVRLHLQLPLLEGHHAHLRARKQVSTTVGLSRKGGASADSPGSMQFGTQVPAHAWLDLLMQGLAATHVLLWDGVEPRPHESALAALSTPNIRAAVARQSRQWSVQECRWKAEGHQHAWKDAWPMSTNATVMGSASGRSVL